MYIRQLHEARWVKITGGANVNDPDYVFPWSHSHEIVEAPDLWLHGTCSTHLPGITKNGLRGGSTGLGYLHLTLNRGLAIFSAKRAVQRWGGEPIILTISTAKLPSNLIGTSLDSSITDIPASAIVKIHKFKARKVSEGVVARARGTVINVVNDLAGRLANVAERVFTQDQNLAVLLVKPRPRVDFADSEEQPATITLLFGRVSPQALTIQIFGDGPGEMKIEMAQRLATLLNLPRQLEMSSEEEIATKLGQIAGTMSERLSSNLRV